MRAWRFSSVRTKGRPRDWLKRVEVGREGDFYGEDHETRAEFSAPPRASSLGAF
jgi:hypothetical protein